MRDMIFLIGMLGMLPFALGSSFVAYLLWGWTTVFSPNYYLYGFLNSFRFNFLFAIISLGLLLLHKKDRNVVKFNLTSVLIFCFLAHTMLSSLLGYPDNQFNEPLATQFLKSIIFCLVMGCFISNRAQLHLFIAMLGIGLGFHGVVEGLKVIASAGGHRITGIPTTMMSDNNLLGLAMVMVIPLLYYLQIHSQSKLARLGFVCTLLLSAITVIGTQSRGGLIALSVLALWLFFTSRSKFRALLIIALGVSVLALITPESWFDRMNTIKTADADSSFMGRVSAWKISSAIALENPIFGGGFHAVQAQPIWEKFKFSQGFLGFVNTPEPEPFARAAHSIYFEILGDQGFPGLLLFLLILGNVFVNYFRIRQTTRNMQTDCSWAVDMANALMLSILAYCVGGAALSLGYFEVTYMLAMLMEILRQCVSRMHASSASLSQV